MFKSYEETLDFLYCNLPMFQRVGAAAMKPDLTNTVLLCQALDNPQLKFKSIHVAGTNGKGSTSHMLASILQRAGYKTGLYTSPHLKEFTERIRVDGQQISKDFIVDFTNRMMPSIIQLKPSFFEITVAMAFEYFVKEDVDIAVIEVGLGGRLDSTNVITPELSIITNISWDHMDLLGNTLEEIAKEKAGIIKASIPVVISERQEKIDKVFETKASATHSPIFFASDYYRVTATEEGDGTLDLYEGEKSILKKIVLPLQGSYQKKNLLGVTKAVEILRRGGWIIDDEHFRLGLLHVAKTGLKGRWQVLGNRPDIVCDTAHNVDGIREVLHQIEKQSYQKLFIVFGMVKDKEVGSILKILPSKAYYFFCQAKIPRALDATLLCSEARQYGLEGEVTPDVNLAIDQAKKRATPEDMIFIGGSTFVVAEVEDL